MSNSDTPENLNTQVSQTLRAALSALGKHPAQPQQTPTPPKQTAPPKPQPKKNTGLPYWHDESINSATFDLNTYLTSIPYLDRLIKESEGRKLLTQNDPLLFALTYLPHHLKDPNFPSAPPSFADCHFDWCRLALHWAAARHRTTPPKPQEDRIAEVAPRMCGKSTWWFLIMPLWAAAHGHKRFVAAFASTATQAEKHLNTLKNEIDNNRYLRTDYPDLCAPKRRPRGAVVADRVDEFQSQNGFVFIAKGVDSSNLGMKVEQNRPDLILLDDVEPDERSYSADLAQKRLGTIQDAILQLNIYASVVFVGTVTMPNSIIHQLVKHARQQRTEQWITDESIKPHYYPPIVVDATTMQPRSLWPQKWSLEYLQSIQHTRSYAKNYANDPRGRDGDFWNDEDFTQATQDTTAKGTRTALFLDPPTTSSRTSDPAGIAVVTWAPPTRLQQHELTLAQIAAGLAGQDPLDARKPMSTPPGYRKPGQRKTATNRTVPVHPGTCTVLHASSMKLTGRPLAKHVYKLIQQNPQWGVRRIIVEATQGGDLWLEVFADSPLLIEITNPRESKEERFGRALEYYQKRPTLVTHDPKAPLSELEEQMMGFPKMAHDDIADATVAGVLYFLEPKPRKRKVRTRAQSYV